MSANEQGPSRLRFGAFELNVSARELRKHGIRVRLRGQAFQLLVLLVKRHGEIVSREEMRARLWPEGTFVDFEHSVNTAVKKLRAALGDSPENSRYIETFPRMGYRFVAPVKEVPASPPTAGEAPLAASPPSVAAAMEKPAHRAWPVFLGIAVVLSAALGAYLQWSSSRARAQPASGRLMLAVLPFENLTGDAGQDYFSDGLTEEMITQLGHLDPQRLGVIARTSVMHYKNSQIQLEQIGRELGVQYVLEGSVRRDSGKVRITAQLIQMKDQSHLWSREYDRELSGLLTLQGEIAQQTAVEILRTLGDHRKQIVADGQPAASPSAYEAYDFYLRGRYLWNERTAQGFQQAIEHFQQAIAIDPNYARAYAGLADSYAMASGYIFAPQNEFMPKARAAARRALQIDDSLAEAHTSLAVIAQNYDWDWQTAEKEYRRAIELDPDYATAHHWYAECLAFQGRFDAAFAESERARQLDPLSLIIAADHGAILYFSRQYDRAIEQLRAVLEMEPNFPRAHVLVFAYVQKGRFADALAEIENWRRIDDSPWTWGMEAYVHGRSGQQAQARRALEKMEQMCRQRKLDPTPMLVLANVGMDHRDAAFALFEKAYAEHSNSLTSLKVDPIYDPLRSDPRFEALLRRVGLAQ